MGRQVKNPQQEASVSAAEKNTVLKKESKKKSVPETKPSGKKTASSKAASGKKAAPKKNKRAQSDADIFALDIGTRTVVGVLGHMNNQMFCVDAAVSIPHTQRAMIDGQIEDIDEVAKVVSRVKAKLEEKTGIKLSKVSIAAAGRALKTRCTSVDFDIEDKESINEDMLKSFELEAVSKAQSLLNEEVKSEKTAFYCVGHTVIRYLIDDYPIKTLIGHKGKKATVELIAAFLPGIVVESLYAVTDRNNLDVISLTLEPIAAMNVIIPPEVRLINIALVDIGAGTSDIAISQDGSIVAYAMATVAGDEITEDIVKKYIVDFNTAEEMKQSTGKDEIKYKDILGFEHTVSVQEFYKSLFSSVDFLADTIAKTIVGANGSAPAAVFLVGGGSLIPELPKCVAEKLGIPENRVAVGGKSAMKNVSVGKTKLDGPEFVTPIGIGVTATMQGGYDFSTIMLNGRKMRVFDTKKLSALDLLMMAGYKSTQIIPRSGRTLVFTLNGEKQVFKGGVSTPASITINGSPATLDNNVKQGDVIEFTPAISGISASVSISDIAGDISYEMVTVDNVEYPLGNTVTVNGKLVSSDYKIQNLDEVVICNVETLDELIRVHSLDESASYFKGTKRLKPDAVLYHNDFITSKKDGFVQKAIKKPEPAVAAEPVPVKEETVQPEKAPAPVTKEEVPAPEKTVPAKPEIPPFSVILNGRKTVLDELPPGTEHQFIELMSLADIDLGNPPPSGNMILTLNGREAGFMDVLHQGDQAVIKWDTV